MSGEPTLSRDRTNDPEWVAYLQQRLVEEGHEPGPADGIFGPRTEAAVEAYQRDHDLQVDGIVGRQTWASLHGEAPQPPGEHEWGDRVAWGDGSDDERAGEERTGDVAEGSGVEVAMAGELTLEWGALTFGVVNTGLRDWGNDDVIYLLGVVAHESGMATQSENDAIRGVAPWETRTLSVPLATDAPGRYSADVIVTVGSEVRATSSTEFLIEGSTSGADREVSETGGV